MEKTVTIARARELIDRFEKNGDRDLGFMLMVDQSTQTIEVITFNADKQDLITLLIGFLIELRRGSEEELDEDRVLN